MQNQVRILLLIFICSFLSLAAQDAPLINPSVWNYPMGNPSGTLLQLYKSAPQELECCFNVKWSTSAISGDVQPLIGNIINNAPVSGDFFRSPNEIVAYVNGQIVILDAYGRQRIAGLPFDVAITASKVSLLIDTTTESSYSLSGEQTMVFCLEGYEQVRDRDSVAYAWVMGVIPNTDSLKLIRRLAVSLGDFAPNTFASVTPFYARAERSTSPRRPWYIYVQVNMTNPVVQFGNRIPFYRGIGVFSMNEFDSPLALFDASDEKPFRFYTGPEVTSYPPSVDQTFQNGRMEDAVVLPSFYPTPTIQSSVATGIDSTIVTFANTPYVAGLRVINEQPSFAIRPYFINSTLTSGAIRPIIRMIPFSFTDVENETEVEKKFYIVSEEYTGRDTSIGRSKLHLFQEVPNFNFIEPITFPNSEITPFLGDSNHLWSIGIGNVDGTDKTNEFPAGNGPKFFPFNPGNEIVVTQSSKDFVIAQSKISVLRYRTDEVMKAVPLQPFRKFDTIATAKISGWLAAINDLDGQIDGKEEIILVDGSELKVLRLRDYKSKEFLSGDPFQIVYKKNFPFEQIRSVAVADLEGDGLNDIIVTTTKQTYALGSPLICTTFVSRAPIPTSATSGDEIKISGQSLCAKPVRLEYSYDQVNWTFVDSAITRNEAGSFSFITTVPCPYFECTESIDNGKVVYFRVSTTSSGILIGDTIPVIVFPKKINFSVDNGVTPCPYFAFRWTKDSVNIGQNYTLYYSLDSGSTFIQIASVPASNGFYEWSSLPTKLPPMMKMRLCGLNDCIITDTTLIFPTEENPDLVIVAPNPFNPMRESAEIVYSVPENSNLTIRVYDENNRVVAEPIRNSPRMKNVSYCDRWDGTRMDGSYSANGMYYISLEYDNGMREIRPVYVRKK